MYSRMEKNHGQKVQRFSIRKYSFGAASVAVAAYMMFGGAATVQADAQVTPKTASDSQTVPDASNQADSTMPLASTETATPTAEQPSTPAPAATQPTAPTETPKAEEALAPASKADTSKLEAAIARMEAALEKAGLTEKTASAIEAAKAELAKAQSLLSNDKATQTEVDYSTSSLKNRAFVLESMPKATADKKENKNQDSRNGQAIPGQGESGFRAVDTTAANSAEEATKYKGARDAALPELEANIAKIKAELAAEEGKAANKQDLAKIDTYKKVIEKAEGIATAAKAADATSAKEMSKQAEAVKSERDLLKLYLDGKADLGAPVSENHAGYGNNPSNGVFESLKEGFGDKVTFSDADKKSFTVAKQYESGRDLTNKIKNLPDAKDPIGSATYNWQEKAITKADAEAGMLNGWKIENGEKVNAVKPLDVTNVTDKDGNTSDREVWKSKVYTNDGELIKYQTSGEVSYVNGSGLVPLAMPTITGRASEDSSKRVLGMQNNTFGEVKNRDYYLELGSQGTTLSKEYDVNANSRLTVSLIHSGAYGGSTATDAGERVKLKIVDAFTGAEIKPVDGKDGALTTEQGPYSGTGWTHLDRLYDIPEGTTKVKVLIEAGEQGTNSLINNNNIKLKDGYIIGGIGIATAPAAEVVTNVRSENKKGEYGYTKDTIYEKGQKGVFDIDIKNTGGMNIDYYTAQKVEVTVKVPKGVTLEDKIYNANGGSAYLGHTFANDIVWTPNDPADNTQGGTITYKVPAGNRMPAAEAGSRKTEIPFTTADNFIGPADFKVTVKSGFGDTDALGNRLYSYTALGTDPAYSNQFNRNGLADSDNPDYVYGKVIFINSLKGSTVVTVPINTTNGQLKEVAIAKAKEEIASANFIQLLEKMKATAALGDTTGSLSNVQISSKDKVEITKIAEDGRGIVKVPVTYTADGKTYETTVDVEVNVVKSTTKPVVVFEGDEIAPATVKENVTPAEIDKKAGQANEPQATDIFDTNGKVGQTDLKVPTTVTYNVDGTTITENVEVPVTVLPRPKADEILVAKNSDKEEAKAKILEKAKAALGESYTNKLPAGVTFDKDNMTVGEIPELTEDGEVPVTVKYTVNGEEKTTVIKVPVTVVEGTPQIVPVDPKTAPKAEDSIDPADYPEGAKFTYEKEPDTSSTGDKEVKVIVTDKDGNELVTVPTTVRVVDAYRQYVPVNTDPTKVVPAENIVPTDFPDETTFEYKTPVDTSTPGDKDVVVVAKLNGEPIAEIPAKVTVVGPKTQYVVANPDNTQPTPADSLVDKDKYGFPDNATFEYKEKVDTTTPDTDEQKDGKDVTVVVKDADGDTIVEVPAKVKVVQGNPQIIPVDQGQPLAENSINKGDYPEGATFEYEKVDGKDPVNISEAGDNPVTVVVKDKDGNVLVKVPTTVRVVDAYRQYVPVNTDPTKVVPAENIVPTDFPDGTTFEYKTPVDTSTPGDKDVVVVAKLNDKPIAEIPAKVTVVGPKTQYVAANPENTQPDPAKSLTDKDKDNNKFPDDAKFGYKEPVDTKTPGEKDATVVVKDAEDDTIVEVPAKVKVVQGNPQIIPVDQGQPLPENSINIGDYPEGATFEYKKVDGKDPVNISEPGDYPVNVIVKDKEGNKLVEVPTTVRVVGAYRQYVPVDTDPKKVIPAENIVPTDFPDGTTFEYKTPVDTTTPGDKEVVVVAKLNGEPIAEIPAKVTVVGPKTQYVAANPENTQPDPAKSVDSSIFPKEAESKVGYKEDVDTKKPGIKDVTVVVKDKDGDSIVEVPAKVIVVQGKEQEVTVNPDKAPEAKDNINPKDFPEGATFTFKEQPDTKTPGKKNVIVVVKDKDGNLLVEVPAVVNVVERKEEPQTPKETVTATPIVVEVGTPITKEDVKGHVKLPKDAEIIEVVEIPTTETPGVKPSAKVRVKLPTGEIIELEVPVKVTPNNSLIPQTEPSPATPAPQTPQTPQPAGPTAPEQPVTPTEPGQPATPNQTQPAAPAQADTTVATDTTAQPVSATTAKPATPKYVEGQKELPNTGTEDHASLAALGLLGVLSGFGLVARKKKED